jgi:hypothetical protein
VKLWSDRPASDPGRSCWAGDIVIATLAILPAQLHAPRPQFRRYEFAQIFSFGKGNSLFPLTAACGGDHYDIGCDSLDRWSRRSLYRQSPSEQLLRKPFSADRFDRCLQQLYMLDQPREFDGIDFVLR